MKLEIEIGGVDLKSAIERKVRVAVAEYSSGYNADQLIKECIKKLGKETMTKTVEECVNNSEALKDKINKALENKIKAQFQAVLNKAKV